MEGYLFFHIERELKIRFLDTCSHINMGIARCDVNAILITADIAHCCIPIHPLWQSNRITYSALEICAHSGWYAIL